MSSLLVIVSLVIALASFLRVSSPAPDQVSPSDSGHSLVTKDAEKAKIAALCHVACLNFLFDPTDGAANDTNGTEVRLQY